MNSELLTVESELVRLMMRLGYIATWNGLRTEALRIFEAVRVVRPDSENPAIGAAVLAMVCGHPEQAAQLLREEALQLNPESEFARAHLGCALRLSGAEEEGRSLLNEVIATSADPSASELAKNILALGPEELLKSLGKL